jgi:Carboxypeptidase regulatory-like domain
LVRIAVLALLLVCTQFFSLPTSLAQEQTSAGLVGQVVDPSGSPVAGATVTITNSTTSFYRSVRTNPSGRFSFAVLQPGLYSLRESASGFRTQQAEVTLHSGEVANLTSHLELQALQQEITVAAGTANSISLNVNETHLNSGLVEKLPSESANAALSSILTLATPGVAADSNGVFHPLGEHAETFFSVDGQPISDQQSRIFSNQISVDTIQEMKTLQGAPPAEFGDKTSLIVEVETRSGLNAGKPSGELTTGYGSFASPTASLTLSYGSGNLGNFLAIDGIDSDRFLDTPEFQSLHASGNAENLFDRIDWRPSSKTTVHLNLSAARSWFQVPNTYDQQTAGQDQRQHMTSFNADLGLSRVLGPSLFLSGNAWLRQDGVNYDPSANLLADQSATLSQSRQLTSTGTRSDLAYARGRHAFKTGVQVQVWPLSETFSTGLTDPAFNSPCVDGQDVPVGNASLSSPSQCSDGGYAQNAFFQPTLLPYDLTRGGSQFQFRGVATIREESAYAQDGIRLGQLNLNLGLRYDNYDGLGKGSAFQPRVGFAYRLPATGTVLHMSYARVFLTPYNENLVLSSSTGAGGLGNGSFGASRAEPLMPAKRNQFNVGFEQEVGGKLTVEGEYFWKFTRGAYDFNTILNTPLNFPIQFRKSKIDGAMVRVTLRPAHGFSAFTVIGHTRSRLFGPEIGGINFGTAYASVARPDHDQGFEQTTNLQYQLARQGFRGLWLGLTWRFDSGLVVVSVPDYATALTLTGDEQNAMGLYCGDTFASVKQPLRSCDMPHSGSTLVHIAPPGTYNADTNPSRIASHSLFDVAVGSENLWKREHYSVGMKLTAVNVANKVALYNFLSSFSGTHFVAPRTYQAEISLHF